MDQWRDDDEDDEDDPLATLPEEELEHLDHTSLDDIIAHTQQMIETTREHRAELEWLVECYQQDAPHFLTAKTHEGIPDHPALETALEYLRGTVKHLAQLETYLEQLIREKNWQ